MKIRWQGVLVLLLLLDGSLSLQAWPMMKGNEYPSSNEVQQHEKLTTEEARFRKTRLTEVLREGGEFAKAHLKENEKISADESDQEKISGESFDTEDLFEIAEKDWNDFLEAKRDFFQNSNPETLKVAIGKLHNVKESIDNFHCVIDQSYQSAVDYNLLYNVADAVCGSLVHCINLATSEREHYHPVFNRAAYERPTHEFHYGPDSPLDYVILDAIDVVTNYNEAFYHEDLFNKKTKWMVNLTKDLVEFADSVHNFYGVPRESYVDQLETFNKCFNAFQKGKDTMSDIGNKQNSGNLKKITSTTTIAGDYLDKTTAADESVTESRSTERLFNQNQLLKNVKEKEKQLDDAYILYSAPLLDGSDAHWKNIIQKVTDIKECYAALKMEAAYALWKARVSWYEAKKEECIAFSLEAQVQAKSQKVTSLFPWSEASSLKRKKKQQEQEAKNTFHKTVEAFTKGISTVSDASKLPWIETLENLLHWNPPNSADVSWYEHEKEAIKATLAASLNQVRADIGGKFPQEIKEEVMANKSKAFAHMAEAASNYLKALDAPSAKKETSWREAFEDAKKIQEDWKEVKNKLEQIPSQLHDGLGDWIQKECHIAEGYISDWDEVLSQFNRSSLSDGPSTLKEVESGELTLKDLKEFPYASLVGQEKVSNYCETLTKKEKILKTPFENGSVFIEEWFKNNELLNRSKMVANRLLVSLREEKQGQLLDYLKQNVSHLEFSVEKVSPYMTQYRVYFKPVSLTAIAEVTKVIKNYGVSPIPDELISLDKMPNDERYRKQQENNFFLK